MEIFDLTLDEVFDTYTFTFPCKEHANKILSYTIVYCIRLRMRQYAYQENLKQKSYLNWQMNKVFISANYNLFHVFSYFAILCQMFPKWMISEILKKNSGNYLQKRTTLRWPWPWHILLRSWPWTTFRRF